MKDNQIIHRSTIERRSIYRSIRNEDPRYADSIVGSPDYMVCDTFPFIFAASFAIRHRKCFVASPTHTQ